MLETEDISYLVKVDVKVDEQVEEEEEKDYYNDEIKDSDEQLIEDTAYDEDEETAGVMPDTVFSRQTHNTTQHNTTSIQ